MSQDPVFDYLTKQATYLKYLKNFLVNSIDKVKATDRTETHFKNRLRLLDQYWHQFMTNNDSLIIYYADDKYKEILISSRIISLKVKIITLQHLVKFKMKYTVQLRQVQAHSHRQVPGPLVDIIMRPTM